TAVVIALVWLRGQRAGLPKRVRAALHGLTAVALLQVALGIATLLLVVPVPLAAAHQAGAVLLLTAAINFRHTLRKAAPMDEKAPAPISVSVWRGRRRWRMTAPFRQSPSTVGLDSRGRS